MKCSQGGRTGVRRRARSEAKGGERPEAALDVEIIVDNLDELVVEEEPNEAHAVDRLEGNGVPAVGEADRGAANGGG
jgi:hypothetical protein